MESAQTQKKKKAIADAAAELFLDKGYGNVSMDEIASVAGVSKRTVYNHFPSKQTLFSETVAAVWSMYEPPVISYRPGADIREDLIVFAGSSLRMLRSERFTKLLRLVMGESGRFPELAEIYSDNGIRSLIVSLRDYLVMTGKKIEDPQLAAQQFLGMVKEALFWPVLLGIIPAPSAERDREVIALSADMFIRLYSLV